MLIFEHPSSRCFVVVCIAASMALASCSSTPVEKPVEIPPPEPVIVPTRDLVDVQRIDELEQQLSEQQRQLTERQRQLSERRRQLTEQQRQKAEQQRQFLEEKQRLERELKESQNRSDELQRKLDAILAIDRELRRGTKNAE